MPYRQTISGRNFCNETVWLDGGLVEATGEYPDRVRLTAAETRDGYTHNCMAVLGVGALPALRKAVAMLEAHAAHDAALEAAQ